MSISILSNPAPRCYRIGLWSYAPYLFTRMPVNPVLLEMGCLWGPVVTCCYACVVYIMRAHVEHAIDNLTPHSPVDLPT